MIRRANLLRIPNRLSKWNYATVASIPKALLHDPTQPQLVRYGQPLPSTHPHLLNPGELTPGIQFTEYESRRKKLMNQLNEGDVVIITSARIKYMSGNIFYKFRQNTDFWYFTGWEEPDSVLVLEKNKASERGYRMFMFVPLRDKGYEKWNGPRSGPEGAIEIFAADEAYGTHRLSAFLESILSRSNSLLSFSMPSIYVKAAGFEDLNASGAFSSSVGNAPHFGRYDEFEIRRILEGLGRSVALRIKSGISLLESQRLIKSGAEISTMKKTADISSAAHVSVMKEARPGITEAHLVGCFEYECVKKGSVRPAYVPVCASGSNALTIHYTSNQLPLNADDLVVIDAGCEYGGYASDITRTFPVSGKFSSAQKDLYEALLRVQKECVKLCIAGTTMDRLHRMSVDKLKIELQDLGFDTRSYLMENVLYPHYLTHPVGIDLHDTMSFKRDEELLPGMVITIEPGIFVPPTQGFPQAFHNLNVRLEDEVVVSHPGQCPMVLSANAPKEIADIEAVCSGYFP